MKGRGSLMLVPFLESILIESMADQLWCEKKEGKEREKKKRKGNKRFLIMSSLETSQIQEEQNGMQIPLHKKQNFTAL